MYSKTAKFGSRCPEEKKKRCSWRQRVVAAFKLNWKEYSRNSVLRYLVEERRPPAERAFWSLSLALTLALCIYQMGNLYDQWKSNSVILLTSTSRLSLHELPFPAISLCPNAQTNLTLLNCTEMMYRTSQNYSKSFSKDEILKLSVLSVLCDVEYHPDKFNLPTNEEFLNFLKSVAPHMRGTVRWIWNKGDDKCGDEGPENDTLPYWQWPGNEQCLCPPVVPVLSNIGVCYTFNLLPAERRYRQEINTDASMDSGSHREIKQMYWDVDKGYPGPPPEDDDNISNNNNGAGCPRRATGGVIGGLTVILFVTPQEVDYCCVAVPGFTLVVHSPAELPFVDIRTKAQLPAQSLSDIPLSGQQSYSLPDSKSTTVVMKPIRVISRPRLRSYSPASRNCYFTGEKELRFFRVYTLQNCRLECLTNLTWKMCNCTAFYMPQIDGVQVCYGTRRDTCADETRQKKYKDTDCNCLPGCNSLQYDTRSIHSELGTRDDDDDDDEPAYLFGMVEFVFPDMDYSPYVRAARISSLEFLANCGGLLSLVSGFSLLSLVEVLYFLCIRKRTEDDAEAARTSGPPSDELGQSRGLDDSEYTGAQSEYAQYSRSTRGMTGAHSEYPKYIRSTPRVHLQTVLPIDY